MVTGGKYDTYNRLDSTEILRPGSDYWHEITFRLPRPMCALRVMTVEDNRVLLFGE